MIPGAFERNVQPKRATRAASLVRADSSRDARPQPVTDGSSYVVAAPAQPTTFLGHFTAVLGDIALSTAVVLGLALAPVLAVQVIIGAAAFILDALGGQ